MKHTCFSGCSLKHMGCVYDESVRPLIGNLAVAAIVAVGALRADAAAPFSFTQAAAPVSVANATLNGMVTPNGLPTVAWFEWGTNATFALTTNPEEVGSGSASIRFSAPVTALDADVIYSCRLVASNAAGLTQGNVQFFGIGHRVMAWGDNGAGQLNVPASLSNIVAVAAGHAHGVALKSDGKAVAWGANDSGQTNVPVSYNGLIAVAAGFSHSLALRTNGFVRGWGADSYGQVAGGLPLTNVAALAAGYYHSLALKRDGKVSSWGSNEYGQTNVPPNLTNAVAVAAGGHHCLAIRNDGSVVAWGWNKYGQTNVPPAITGAVAVAAGFGHSLALLGDGNVRSWGRNTYGQINVPADLSNVVAIAAGPENSLALRSDSTVAMWGFNANGQSTVPVTMKPAFAASAGGAHTLTLVVGPDLPLALTGAPKWLSGSSVRLHGWVIPNGVATTAWFEWGQDGNLANASAPTDVGGGTNPLAMSVEITGLAADRPHIYRLVASNQFSLTKGPWQLVSIGRKLCAWGAAGPSPSDLPRGVSNVVAIAGGVSHGLALPAGGTVVAWGDNAWGQTDLPAGLSDAVGLAAGDIHSLVLRDDGNLTAFGHNLYGQSQVPPQLTNAVAVSAGRYHNLAIRNDGSVLAWGEGTSGGTSVPPGLTDATGVAGGWQQSLALRRDGKLTYWGYDAWGSAKQAASLSDVVAIASGYSHCLALRSNGTVVAWGRNNAGQTNVPAGLSNVVAVSAGSFYSLALRSDGAIVAWGDNSSGQTNPPASVIAEAAVDGGGGWTLAIGGNALPWVQSQTNHVPADEDSVIQGFASDPNNDPCSLRVSSLPATGSLYQFTLTGRGDPITLPNTTIIDPAGRVIFSPQTGQSGIPYTALSLIANDGDTDSAPGTWTLNVIPRPVPQVSWASGPAPGVFELSFSGLTNAAYSIWVSADLTNWSFFGTPSQPEPGLFLFTDATTNYPQRFYRVSAP